MMWSLAKATAVGGREEQQDRVDIWSDQTASAVLAVVADGLGGHEHGALAAQTVVDAAREIWLRERHPVQWPNKLLQEICALAHRRITEAGQKARNSPMSTCALLYADDKLAAWAHVGDSRIYRFRRGKLVERTKDHSVIQSLRDQGEIREEDMATHPDQNLLLQSLGGSRDPTPSYDQASVEAGDAFLLCSDGFWESVSPAEMASAFSSHALPQVTEALVAQAAHRRGEQSDNVSAALIRAGGANAERTTYHRNSVVIGAAVVLVALLVAGTWIAERNPGPGRPPVTAPAPQTTSQLEPRNQDAAVPTDAMAASPSEETREAARPSPADQQTGMARLKRWLAGLFGMSPPGAAQPAPAAVATAGAADGKESATSRTPSAPPTRKAAIFAKIQSFFGTHAPETRPQESGHASEERTDAPEVGAPAVTAAPDPNAPPVQESPSPSTAAADPTIASSPPAGTPATAKPAAWKRWWDELVRFDFVHSVQPGEGRK